MAHGLLFGSFLPNRSPWASIWHKHCYDVLERNYQIKAHGPVFRKPWYWRYVAKWSIKNYCWQDNCNSSCSKTQNIQHIANLAIRLLSCATNLRHCRIILGFEKFLEFHCIFCTSCKDVHSRYFQTMSFVAIYPSNWAITCPPLLCRNRMFSRMFFWPIEQIMSFTTPNVHGSC